MAIVSQRASLSNWGPDNSQLDIDGIPDKYNRAGTLGSLPPESSNLNLDATPEKYDTQGKLEDIYNDSANNTNPVGVDNFLNTNAGGFTVQAPVGVTQFINDGQTSQYGLPATPDRYDTAGQLGSLPPNASQLNFDGALPPPVDNFLNTNANGFTIQAPIGVTQFIDPGNTSIYGFAGAIPPPTDFFLNTHANGFTIQTPIGVTQFIDTGNTSIYGFSGATPPGVDYFTNNHANGFSIKNPVGISQFTNGGQTSIYGFQRKLPPAVNFFTNTRANGFTLQNPIGVTQFIGVGGSGTSYINPSGLNALRNVNFFRDEFSGAEGFKDRPAVMQTYYLGINADQTKYQYPLTVQGGRLMNVRLGRGAGTAKLENQLGNGSKMGNTGFYAENRYESSVKSDANKSFLTSWALREHSPSPLDTAYTYSSYYGHDLKLRSTAYNPTYMMHPLILRGLQNPDHLGPQRWGLTASPKGQKAAGGFAAALDGGFIRGGASTAVERAAIDTARIAKFIASPKGIVWIATQVGLGKSNPLVEKNPLNTLPFNDTRSHSGLTTLLSIPGSAFGTHITRHGIPFANELASYEKVITSRIDTQREDDNRLIKIKKELFGTPNPSPVGLLGAFQQLSNFVKGSDNPIIQTISGLGGPGSVYGIGATNIRRYINSRNFNVNDEITKGVIERSRSPLNYYAGIYKPKTGHLGDPKLSSEVTGRGRDITEIDESDFSLKSKLEKSIDENNSYAEYTPPFNVTDGSNESGNKYSVLPYNEIRRIARDRTVRTTFINDFRIDLTNSPDAQKTFSTSGDIANYAENNLRDKYGFGDHGNREHDRSNPFSNDGGTTNNVKYAYDRLKVVGKHGLATDSKFKGDKINAIDYIPSTDITDIYPTGVRDFIAFYFAGIDVGVPGATDDVVPFRATVKSISDSFNPGWSPVAIMGRPDSPAIYTSFERSVSFDFAVAATTREELVPMWRKLNYLATFTMPVYSHVGGRPQGPIMRLTIGNMFKRVPGYITSLTIAVNDEATWDLAEDFAVEGNDVVRKSPYPKQLPNLVDVNCTFGIIHDYRPQKGGRVYSLYDANTTEKSDTSNWLYDARY